MKQIITFPKTLLVIASLLLSFLWTLFCAVVGTTVGFFSKTLGNRIHWLWCLGVVKLMGIKISILGAENIPKQGGIIFAANHQSMFDIFVLGSLNLGFKWIAKAELARVPFIGRTMKTLGFYFVQRNHSENDKSTLDSVASDLKAGARIAIFPEGTRSKTGQLLPLKKGAFRLSQSTDVPLLPIRIRGTFEIAPPKQIPLRRSFDVTVQIYPRLVIPESEAGITDAMKQFESLMQGA